MREQLSPFRLGNISHFELQVLERALLTYLGKPKFVNGKPTPKPREQEIIEAKLLLRLIDDGMKEIEEEWKERLR